MEIQKLEKQFITNCPENFLEQLNSAIKLAKDNFRDMERPEGDKYIDHSLQTAIKLQEASFDTATVITGLLHHIELNNKNREYIKNKIDEDIITLIEKYADISTVIKNTDASYTLSTRYILNSVKDLRAVLVQVFNAQSNSHMLDSIENNEARKEMIQRNLNIYSNLAEYLGFDKIKTDIAEESFRITQKEDFEYIERLYENENISQETFKKYERYIKNLLGNLKQDLEISGRIKSKHSAFNKLKKYINEGETDPINRISDLIGFRILCKRKSTCFKILDTIWDKGEIIIEEFDDYISHPKPNGYKAIQGPIIFPEIGELMVEIQILTEDMYEYNTYGPASHIAYKESLTRFAKPSDKYNWIKDVQLAIKNNKENSNRVFSVPITVDIFPGEVYAMTPKGSIIELSLGDTVTDFAYQIHTDIGNSMIAAKVNEKAVSLDHQLQTGDVVEIVTQRGKMHPKPDLLRYANSDTARIKIQRAIKQD
jgi:GTP pyrophosphokinase